MKALKHSTSLLRCRTRRSFSALGFRPEDFYKTASKNKEFQQHRRDTMERLDKSGHTPTWSERDSRDESTARRPTPPSRQQQQQPHARWVTPDVLKKGAETARASSLQSSSASAVPGAAAEPHRFTKARARTPTMSPMAAQHDMGRLEHPKSRQTATFKQYERNTNIVLTANNREDGGRRDVYFEADRGDNHYLKQYADFLIQHGFVEEQDIDEQYEWLYESYKTQYDPDDSDGKRLPPNHPGKVKEKWNEKDLYFGKRCKKEKLEFNHFHKSFILDSCPPFPDRMVHHAPNIDKSEAPLYLPHISQNIPTWSLKKKIAKTYGPGYLSQITMPPMKFPDAEDFQAMLKQYVNEKKYKKYAVDKIEEIEHEFGGAELYRHLDGAKYGEQLDVNAFVEENEGRVKQLGVGSPFRGEHSDVIPRLYEIWDKDLCYELKEDGDPNIPSEIKEEVFRQYVNSIDRNGSMAPWQKNYAFSLLPKAFGGPQGDYVEAIVSRMKPKAEQIEYELKEYDDKAKGETVGGIKKQKRMEMREKRKAAKEQKKVDVAGLGL